MLCALAVAAAGCAGPVAVDEPEPRGAERRTCAALLEALPDRVDDEDRREVEPSDAPAAAWGDPPIVLRCGVSMPAAFDETATCQVTNGVGWFIPDEQWTSSPTEVTMTTIGRDVNVEVRLPDENWPPANTMVDLAEAINERTRVLDPCV